MHDARRHAGEGARFQPNDRSIATAYSVGCTCCWGRGLGMAAAFTRNTRATQFANYSIHCRIHNLGATITQPTSLRAISQLFRVVKKFILVLACTNFQCHHCTPGLVYSVPLEFMKPLQINTHHYTLGGPELHESSFWHVTPDIAAVRRHCACACECPSAAAFCALSLL